MPGPPPIPTERKRALGNPGKGALAVPSQSLAPIGDRPPKVPSGLKRQGRQAWSRLWGLGRAWLSPVTDLEIITRLCQGYDERTELTAVIRAEGRFVRGSMGQTVSHPAVAQLRALEALLT